MKPLLSFILFVIVTIPVYGQFEEPVLQKTPHNQRNTFTRQFKDVIWRDIGFYTQTLDIDTMPTIKLRALMQTHYGNPTQTIEDIVYQEDFSDRKAIQFEYWLVWNDTIPIVILDFEGPFSRGFQFAGDVRFADLMPEVKRALNRQLKAIRSRTPYEDIYYSPELDKWFDVTYDGVEYKVKERESLLKKTKK